MESLKDILSTLFHEGPLPFRIEDAEIWKVWEDAVGPAVAQNARPDRIRNGELRVVVSDPIWLQELQFLEAEIRERLNQSLNRHAVRKLVFRKGSL